MGERERSLRAEFETLLRIGSHMGQRRRAGMDRQTPTSAGEFVRELTAEALSALASFSRDALFVWDAQTDCIWGNESFHRLAGHLEGPAMEAWLAGAHPDDTKPTRSTIEQALSGDASEFSIRYRYRATDGAYHLLLEKGRIIRDESGHPAQVVGRIADLTQQVHAQKELENTRNRLEFIANHCQDIIAVFDLEGRYLYVSPACRKILGIEPEDLIGARPDRRLGEETSRELWERFNREIYDKGWGTLLFEHTLPSGRTIWLESSATVARDADGEPSEIVSVIRDVTDRMEAEQELRDSQQLLEDLAAERTGELQSANRKLRASEARYRAISQLVMGYVFSAALSDESYEMLWMEGQVEETTGWSVEEIKAVHWSELICPEDLAEVARFVRNLTRGGSEATEFRLRQKGPEYRWLRMYAQQTGTDESGRTVVVGACQDVTEAKEREASLRDRTRLLERLTENVPDLILRLDRDARCIHANRRVEEIVGRPVSEVLGKTAEQVGVPIHVADLGRRTTQQVIDQCQPKELEFSMAGPNGERIYEARVVPEVEEDGTVSAALAIIRDVTEHRRARKQLEQERSALQKANVAMEEIMARIRQEPVEVSQRIQANVDKIVMPMIHSLQQQASPQQRKSLELLGEALGELTAPHVDKLSQRFSQLTAAELRICDMVRRGLSSKEIANILDISVSTVSRHRENIRRKLDLAHRGVNLASFLRTHDADDA